MHKLQVMNLKLSVIPTVGKNTDHASLIIATECFNKDFINHQKEKLSAAQQAQNTAETIGSLNFSLQHMLLLNTVIYPLCLLYESLFICYIKQMED